MAELRFKNGTFKIMVVGDVHEKYPPDAKTEDMLRMIHGMLDTHAPDLAVVMGDIASDYRVVNGETRHLTPEEMKEAFRLVFSPYVQRGIPFAFVFGNHDAEKIYSKPELLSMIRSLGGCVITDTPGITGCGNCNVIVKSSDGRRDALNLWFLDSLNRAADGGYDWVRPDQIVWYQKTCDALAAKNGGRVVPAMLFQHIPVPEEYKLLKKVSSLHPAQVRGHGVHSDSCFVIADTDRTVGYLGEGPCTPDVNSCEFAAWKDKGDVFAAFFGHDHMNDFAGVYDGILLAQCKCSGFHIYGDGLRQGVRMIEVDEQNVRGAVTRMHYYRDLFGTQCNSIRGADLLSDRVRRNCHVATVAAGALAGTAALTVAAVAAYRAIKKQK